VRIYALAIAMIGYSVSIGVSQEKMPETKKTLEPAVFWADIANDTKLDSWRRGLGIHMLFEKYVREGTTLRELAGQLGKPNWAKSEDIRLITRFTGDFSLEPTPGDTLICIDVYWSANPNRENGAPFAVTVNVSGEIEVNEFLAAIQGEKSKYADRVIKAWCVYPDWNSFVKRIPVRPPGK
jgi:hypothetical protein